MLNASNGFFTLAPGQYLMVTNFQANGLRDWLRALGATQVVVLQLEGSWATWARADLAEWLPGTAPFF